MQHEIYTQTNSAAVDAGLRSYMQKVYNFMAGGLCVTALAAWLVVNTSLMNLFFNVTPQGVSLSGFGWLAFIAPLIMVFAFNWVVRSGTSGQVHSLVRVFLITAGAFGGLSLYGYTTKRDLTGFGSFLYMGLIGLIIATIVNIFLKSSGLDWALSIIGVGIFSGLTAYDSQKIRQIYSSSDDKALTGALSLYLDFINLFLYLLRFLGDRR